VKADDSRSVKPAAAISVKSSHAEAAEDDKSAKSPIASSLQLAVWQIDKVCCVSPQCQAAASDKKSSKSTTSKNLAGGDDKSTKSVGSRHRFLKDGKSAPAAADERSTQSVSHVSAKSIASKGSAKPFVADGESTKSFDAKASVKSTGADDKSTKKADQSNLRLPSSK